MEFLKICFALCLVQIASGAICREGGHCVKPHRDKNFDLSIFKENTDKGAWFMQIGDAVVRSHIAAVLQGTSLTLEDDYAHLCGRSKAAEITTSHANGNWFGFGEKEGAWKCLRIMPGVLSCTLTGSGKYHETNHVYISKTDNKTFMVVVMCYEDGHSGWFLLTNGPSMKDDLKETILDHVESLGFDRENYVALRNDNCPTTNI